MFSSMRHHNLQCLRVLSQPLRGIAGSMNLLEPSEHRLSELEEILLAQVKELADQPWAYFVKSGPYVKIGYCRSAKAIKTRLFVYRTATPEGATLVAVSPGGEKTERLLHQRLGRHRQRGEWFRLNAAVLATMRYEGMWPCKAITGWPFSVRDIEARGPIK